MKLLFGILFILFSVIQDNGKEVIVWEPGKKLTWKDFKGEPEQNSRSVAVTSSGIGYKLITPKDNRKSSCNVIVFAYFSTRNSWYKSKYVNDNVLAHEQLHFDITALYAQKLIKAINGIRLKGDFKTELEKLYSAVVKEMDAVQKQYDHQTESSINESAQIIWQNKIEGQLKQVLNQ